VSGAAVVVAFCVVDVVSETEGAFAGTDPFFASETVIVSACGLLEVGVAEK